MKEENSKLRKEQKWAIKVVGLLQEITWFIQQQKCNTLLKKKKKQKTTHSVIYYIWPAQQGHIPGVQLYASDAVCKYKLPCHFLFGRENININNPRSYHL